MIEKQCINNKDVWLKVEPYYVQRDNSNIIPTEYFTVSYSFEEPAEGINGEVLKDNGEVKLFESPVAALSFANSWLNQKIGL